MRTSVRRCVPVGCVSSIVLTAAIVGAQSNTPVGRFWIAPRTEAIAVSVDSVYLGGQYPQYLGPLTGAFVVVDATTGAVDPAFPSVVGDVYAIVPDGAGGFYVGGDFSSVGGLLRSHVAHILSDGRVASFDPQPDGPVYSLLLRGRTLYAGGDFLNIAGAPRNHVAAIDVVSGTAVASFDPGANDRVSSLALSGDHLYVGGRFTYLGGSEHYRAGAVNALDGTLLAFVPVFGNGSPTEIKDIVVADGIAYFAGSFLTVDADSLVYRGHLAAYVDDPDVTQLLPWDPVAGGKVWDIEAKDGLIYAVGEFLQMNNFASIRRRIAAIDSDGLVTAWDPNLYSDCHALQVAGGAVYVGGSFTQVNSSVVRHRAAAFDTAVDIGNVLPWDPKTSDSVHAISVSGGRVALGGSFSSAGGVVRQGGGALSLTTGEAADWNPGFNGVVEEMEATGEVVYAGGTFSAAGGQTRLRLAELDGVTGIATDWNPSPNKTVRALAIEGTKLYVGGDFTSIAGTSPVHRAVAVNTTDGTLTAWDPGADYNVNAILPIGLDIYLAGRFHYLGNPPESRMFLGSVDATGALALWNPVSDSIVEALARTGDTLLVGGYFGTIAGETRGGAAAFDLSTGNLSGWDPDADEAVFAIEVVNEIAAIAGRFQTVGGQPRNRLAAVDLSNAAVRPWNPGPVTSTYDVDDLASSGDLLFVSGPFSEIAGERRPGFAAFCVIDEPAGLSASATAPNTISLSWTGSGAASYGIYRSDTSDETWQRVASSSAATYLDATVHGGLTYSYRVTAESSDCESDPTLVASAVAYGECGLPPRFDGLVFALQHAEATCGVDLAWRPAAPACGGAVEYAVYRDTSPSMIPSASNRIVDALSTTSMTDTAALSPGVTYYYIVQATDTSDQLADPNLIRIAVAVTGCSGSAPVPVHALTARATDGNVMVEWANPSTLYGATRVCWDEVSAPDDPTTCTNAVDSAGTAGLADSSQIPGVVNGTEYHLSAFVNSAADSSGLWSAALECGSRPFDSPAEVRWVYSTGASALSPPGMLPGQGIFSVSNDRFLHQTVPGASGGMWPEGWVPVAMNAPAQARPATAVLPVTTIAGRSIVTFASSLDGHVYAFDSLTGAELWRSPQLGDGVTAAPSAIFSDFGGSLDHDVLLIGSRSPGGDSKFYGLDPQDGNILWTFDNGGGSEGIGIISSQAQVDPQGNRVFFASRHKQGGSSATLWCLGLNDSTDPTNPYFELLWSRDLGDIDSSPILRGGRLYVGNNAGEVKALDPSAPGADPSPELWTWSTEDGPVKGFVWVDTTQSPTRLFFATTNAVHALIDNTTNAAILWPPFAVANPSPVIVSAGQLWFGTSAASGSLQTVDAVSGSDLGSVQIGGAPAKTVGAPTYDIGTGMIAVGATDGRIYAVEVN